MFQFISHLQNCKYKGIWSRLSLVKLEYPLYIYPCLPHLKVKLSMGFSTPVSAGLLLGLMICIRVKELFCITVLCVFLFLLFQTYFSHETEACKLIGQWFITYILLSTYYFTHEVLSRNTQGMLACLLRCNTYLR